MNLNFLANILDNNIETIVSNQLVPGDILILRDNNIKMPCDCILIDGEVLIDENTLTGEAIPIPKF